MITMDINGRDCVITEDGKVDGYICAKCCRHVYTHSVLTAYCVDCAKELILATYEDDELIEGNFSF